MAKIVLCLDGTGDWAGADNTNVMEVFSSLDRDDPNLRVFYDGGVGTMVDPAQLTKTGRTLMKLGDLAFATSLRDKVLAPYQFLIDNYHPGDEVYIFGFSRGAYTARVLAGFMVNFGLLKKQHQNLALYLWQTYSNISDIGEFEKTAGHLRVEFARDDVGKKPNPRRVQITYLGLWDTVSSVNILERFKTFPNTDYNESVLSIRHAVAIDERRNVFPESLFNPKTPGLQEVWFPGVHRDIGGGGDEESQRISNVTLEWVKAGANLPYGTAKERIPTAVKLTWFQKLKSSFTQAIDPYVLAGIYPMRIWDNLVRGFRANWPNFKHIRPIPENALISDLVDKEKTNHRNLPKSPCYLGDGATQPTYYQIPKNNFSPPDCCNIILGTAVTYTIAVGIYGPRSGPWPDSLKTAVWGLFFLYLLLMALSEWIDKLVKVAYTDRWAPLALALASGIYLAKVHDYSPAHHHIFVGMAIGGVLCLLSQLGRKTVLPAQRVLPAFGIRWITVALGGLLAELACHILAGLCALDSVPRAELDALGNNMFPIAGAIAVSMTLYESARIIQDRLKIKETIEHAKEYADKPTKKPSRKGTRSV